MSTPEPTRRIAVLVGVALGLRLALVWLYGQPATLKTWEYGAIADSLLSGQGFRDPLGLSWMPPVYPFLLAGLRSVGGPYGHHALLALQAAISAATTMAMYGVGRQLFGRSVGLWVAAAYVVYPPLLAKGLQADPPCTASSSSTCGTACSSSRCCCCLQAMPGPVDGAYGSREMMRTHLLPWTWMAWRPRTRCGSSSAAACRVLRGELARRRG